MAISMAMMSSSSSSSSLGSCSSSSSASIGRKNKGPQRGKMVICAAAGSCTDPYRTLQIQRGASEKEVKRAFRQLALQYHPDVCKGTNCGVQFHQINEAYDMVMNSLRASEEEEQWQSQEWSNDADEPMYGMCDSDYDLWEEWMGWEGAGIRDYTSHINPYI